jgi:hypothetical protein
VIATQSIFIIMRLRKDNGEVTKDKTKMEIMARNFFKEFQADPKVQPEVILPLIEPKIRGHK